MTTVYWFLEQYSVPERNAIFINSTMELNLENTPSDFKKKKSTYCMNPCTGSCETSNFVEMRVSLQLLVAEV